MRLFVALELPADLQRAVGELVSQHRPALPKARWVRPENLHLTLAFLGETATERLPDLEAAMADARNTSYDAAISKFIAANPKRISYWLTGKLH